MPVKRDVLRGKSLFFRRLGKKKAKNLDEFSTYYIFASKYVIYIFKP